MSTDNRRESDRELLTEQIKMKMKIEALEEVLDGHKAALNTINKALWPTDRDGIGLIEQVRNQSRFWSLLGAGFSLVIGILVFFLRPISDKLMTDFAFSSVPETPHHSQASRAKIYKKEKQLDSSQEEEKG